MLRLILRGHDAKSIARECELSIHAVNERLRSARRKLGVSSSREAARWLAAHEVGTPNSLVDKEFGIEAGRFGASYSGPSDGRAAKAEPSSTRNLLGYAMIASVILGAAALATYTNNGPSGGKAPRVVATSPVNGAGVSPGPMVLSVTFDRPMRAGNYSFVQTSPDTYPEQCTAPELSRDRRTYKLRCQVRAARPYEVWFNREPYMNFKGADGVSATHFQLKFRTRAR